MINYSFGDKLLRSWIFELNPISYSFSIFASWHAGVGFAIFVSFVLVR